MYSCLCAGGFQLQADGRTCRKISIATNSSIPFKNSSNIPSPTNSSIPSKNNNSACNVNMGDIPCNYSNPVSTCVKRHQICDGTIDCRNGKDESAELCAGTSKCFNFLLELRSWYSNYLLDNIFLSLQLFIDKIDEPVKRLPIWTALLSKKMLQSWHGMAFKNYWNLLRTS